MLPPPDCEACDVGVKVLKRVLAPGWEGACKVLPKRLVEGCDVLDGPNRPPLVEEELGFGVPRLPNRPDILMAIGSQSGCQGKFGGSTAALDNK
jgi:hypothetical protein